MKASELRAKSVDELKTEMLALLKEQCNLRLQRAQGQQAKQDRFGKIRLDIARIKTILKEKGLSV